MVAFEKIARLADPADNCAIATQTLPAATAVEYAGQTFNLSHAVLVGHRFAVQQIAAGQHLLSWQMPFGTASRAIAPGDYLCNDDVLAELRQHQLDFSLPTGSNFVDEIPPFNLADIEIEPAEPLPRFSQTETFAGYERPGGRGAGTRNFIILLAVNSTVAGFTKQLAAQLAGRADALANVDGIVAAVHTEGSRADGNNRELLLRTLAGYIVHPNCGAVLIIDNGRVGLTNQMVRRYLIANGYPLDHVRHHFFSAAGPFAGRLAEATRLVEGWLPLVDQDVRRPVPLTELKIALQCGGSDAFSGISGNPLIAWIARRLLQHGGAANLAETDELQGAEAYVLRRVRDASTAQRFIDVVERFKGWAEQHGHSATANPSGGNRYRGLYNIYLKSLGAAAKRHPDLPLDYVIDYSERMERPGFYFMDSPGNDLESIAGQVGAGCNLIFFVTGNGSITNFPFVPTLKVVTTSERFALLQADMDIDAGQYLRGQSMDELGEATWQRFLASASGERTVGELAGHAQLQIWRDWRLAAGQSRHSLPPQPQPKGQPLAVKLQAAPITVAAAERPLGLILPTSLCAGQIARMAAAQLNEHAATGPLAGFAALAHTEGCGVTTLAEFVDTMLGYMVHPAVGACLLLEHGCEKTHNSYWRGQMRDAGFELDRFGWASIQGDGGIEKSLARAASWFAAVEPTATSEPLRLGLLADDISPELVEPLAGLTAGIIAAGGSVIIPDSQPLARQASFLEKLTAQTPIQPTLRFAQWRYEAGLHLMNDTSNSWTELLTGLGATGAEIFLSVGQKDAFNGHPLVPLLQVGVASEAAERDLVLTGDPAAWLERLTALLRETRSRRYVPVVARDNNLDFQITRGLLAISL